MSTIVRTFRCRTCLTTRPTTSFPRFRSARHFRRYAPTSHHYHSAIVGWEPPPDDLTLPQFLLDENVRHATRPIRKPGTPALIEEETGRKVYLDELTGRTDKLARAIKQRWHIDDGDVVSLFAPNHIDYPVSVWAVHRLGGIIATKSPSLTAEELAYQLEITKPRILITHLDNLPTALAATALIERPETPIILIDAHRSPKKLPYPSLEDLVEEGQSLSPFIEPRLKSGEAKTKIAFLCFSSGTTGKPKAVAISHYNLICNVVQVATFNRINEPYAPVQDRRYRPGDVCTGVLPLYHIYGLVVNLHFIIYGAMTLVIAQKFNFEKLLDSISRYRITHLMIVPPMAVLFCKHPSVKKYDLSSIRLCMVAAAPMSADLTEQLLQALPNIHLGQGYGMTETTAAVSMFPLSQKVGTLGSGGRLVPGTIAKVLKADNTLGKVGEPGELCIQGGQVALGYYLNEDATRETFIDGWMHTGDEVIFQENGDVFVIDRIKELIKVKGNQVAPAELEGHLLGHPDVIDAGVIGIPDEYSGEIPLAFIVLRPEIATSINDNSDVADIIRQSIFKHVSTTKSKYKWLTGGVYFIEAIPKNASGKILRRLLREKAKALPPQ